MADASSDASSDESFIGEVQSNNDGLKAYQFEPRRESDESSTGDSSEEDNLSETDSDNEENHGRLAAAATDWCTCGNCSAEYLRTDEECRCCGEKPATQTLAVQDTHEKTCILNNKDFTALCLSEVVLRNVLVALNNVRADNWFVNPPNNRGLRYASYRQFTWRVHGKLGPGRRRVIPACVTHAIKRAFPKEQGDEYVGFTYGHDSDSD